MEHDCERDSLLAQLNCAIAQKSMKAERIKDIMTNFDNDKNVIKLRILCNSLKHCGTIHFVGLGANDKTMLLQVGGKNISILSREEYTVDEVENILFIYHQKFQLYFNDLITEIIPIDYLNKKLSFIDYVNTALKMSAIQNADK